MAFQKRLDYGFNGYQVPRSCRSARGRSSLKRKIEDTQMGAFELLATVAGKLLEEREASPAHSNVSGGSGTKLQATIGKDNVKQEQRDEEKSLKMEISSPSPATRMSFIHGKGLLRNIFKRKFEKRAVSTSHGGVGSEVISNSPKDGKNGNTNSLVSTTHGGSGVSSSSVAGHESSSQSKDAHVKLSIKSFRVPELFIEISETATVGSLKRSVMEAVAAIIGEGLHVGVLYQGKKIRDDSKTLMQTGICDDDKLDSLGFALEPSPTIGSDFCPKDPPYLVQSDVPQLLTRYPPSLVIDTGFSDASPDTPLANLTNSVESDHDSVLSPTDVSIDKTMPDSRALVPHPAMSVDALEPQPHCTGNLGEQILFSAV